MRSTKNVGIWIPIYIGDYFADTVGLTNAEHGAYLLCIMAYWRKGESLNTKEMRAIAGKEFERIADFFSVVDGRHYHKRIDEELAKARANAEKMSKISALGVARRREIREAQC